MAGFKWGGLWRILADRDSLEQLICLLSTGEDEAVSQSYGGLPQNSCSVSSSWDFGHGFVSSFQKGLEGTRNHTYSSLRNVTNVVHISRLPRVILALTNQVQLSQAPSCAWSLAACLSATVPPRWLDEEG